jgi:hypothetical protein
MAKERRGEPESTSPGPHGMKKTVQRFHKLEKQEKFKYKERVGEEARRVTVSPITKKEFDGSAMTKEQKAAELTRKMERGYRKGYRVPKRPKRGDGRKANRSSRKSGR